MSLGYQERLQALHEVAILLSSVQCLEDIVHHCLDICKKTLGYSWGGFGVLENDHIRYIGSLEGAISEFPIQIENKSIVVRAVKTEKSQLVNDVRKDPDYMPVDNPLVPKMLSELAVPISVRGQVVAIINVEHEDVDAFTDEDKTLVEILAMHISSSMERMQYLQELQEINDSHNRDLIKSYQRISGMVRHDLRSPLTSINNAIYMIEKYPESLPEMLDVMKRSIEFIDKVMQDWKENTLTEQVVREEVNIKALIDSSLNAVLLPDTIDVSVHLPKNLSFHLDQTKMMRVLSNLIKNSVEAMPDGGKIIVNAGTVNEKLTITVEDTGKGISEGLIDRIFEPMFSTKPTGLGLGLAYVKQTVEAHGGEVEVSSIIGEGSIFKITIPNSS
jgi:two-component system sensor histidine kinase HydH